MALNHYPHHSCSDLCFVGWIWLLHLANGSVRGAIQTGTLHMEHDQILHVQHFVLGNFWTIIVRAMPFQVGSTLDDAGPGEVAVSPEVWGLLKANNWSQKSNRSSGSMVLNQPHRFYIHGDTAHPDYVAPHSARKEIIKTLRQGAIPEQTATIIR